MQFNRSIFIFFLFLSVIPTGYTSEPAPIPQEELELLQDYGTALKNTITESKGYLVKIQKKWVQLNNDYAGYKTPGIRKLVDELGKNGLTGHLQNSISTLDGYEKGIKTFTNAKANYAKAVAFYDAYKPDKNNPLRSLEQLSSALEGLNDLIEYVDPSGGMLTKPIRAMIDFYAQSATAFHGALQRVGKRIKQRGGIQIGLGTTNGVEDTLKEKAFNKKFPDETIFPYPWIKYIKPGSNSLEAEFWDNRSNRSFVWWKNKWIELKCGISGLPKAYHGMRIAFGERPAIENLISRCNTNWDKVLEAEQYGKDYYSYIFGSDSCVSKILEYKKIKLDNFPEKEFVARYTFRRDTRKKIDRVIRLLENSIIVEGRVIDKTSSKRGLDNISVTAQYAGAQAQASSETGGWFSLLFNSNAEPDDTTNALVRINASGYKPYSQDWPLRSQCCGWYNINLLKDNEDLIEVPGIVGHKKSWAIETLKSLGLTPEPQEGSAAPTRNESGVILWQYPGKNEMKSRGSTVSFQSYGEFIEAAPPSDDVGDEEEAGESEEGEPVVDTDPPVPSDETNDQETGDVQADYVGGLMIVGNATPRTGEGIAYTACDGEGNPYTKGSFTWNISREDIMSLGRSGNTVSGVGFKPGSSTIILHHDGMTAYLDIKITEDEKNEEDLTDQSEDEAGTGDEDLFISSDDEEESEDGNLFSSSGGEEGTEDEDLFSSSGGDVDQPVDYDETGESDTSFEQEDNFVQQCQEHVNNIIAALNNQDIASAQSFTNSALAFGCDINTGYVDQYIAQIEQRQNDLRDEQERQQQEQERQQQAALEQQFPQQRPQTQNNTNWMGVMTSIVQGMQAIQSQQQQSSPGHSLPTSIPSPFPPVTTPMPPIPGSTGVMFPGAGTWGGSTPGGRTTTPGVKTASNPPTSTSGMNTSDCELKFCPVCAKGSTGVDLLGVAVNSQCTACRTQYKKKIASCAKGDSRSGGKGNSISKFNTYAVIKCRTPIKDYKGKIIRYEIFYDFYGPERTYPKNTSCTTVSKGTWKQCIDKASRLNSSVNTQHMVLP